jgi:hypothetical protein
MPGSSAGDLFAEFGYIGEGGDRTTFYQGATFQSDDLWDLFGKVRKWLSFYTDAARDERYTRRQHLRDFGLLYEFTVIQPEGFIAGSVLEELVQNDWLIFDPKTTSHCVSECLALYQLWASTCQFNSAFGYIRSQGKYLAEKYGIKEGATIAQLK